MASLHGSYKLQHNYLAEAVDELARQRIQCVLGGFSGVTISVDGRKASVKFEDRDECLFAFQRHYKIDIVPGEVEWRFRMIDSVQESARAQ